MVLEKKKKYKLLYKKLVRLKVNPLNNNKFLELVLESQTEKVIYQRFAGQVMKKTIIIRRFGEIEKLKRKKWERFLRVLIKSTKFFQKYKPYTLNHYDSSKFASQGNSFRKNFRKDLLTKKTFNYFYGGLRRKYLKKKMTAVYTSKQMKNSRDLCVELFESRLDSVLQLAKFCSTIKDARQLIAHKHVKVNKKIERNSSYILKQGDLIQINTKSRKIIKTKLDNQFKERFDSVLWPMVPNYLSVSYRTLSIVFGKITNFNFSASLNFKNDNARVVETHYRH
jgi:small subunit ribosomal protein S4